MDKVTRTRSAPKFSQAAQGQRSPVTTLCAMSASESGIQPGGGMTEIAVVTGDRYRVTGDPRAVEQTILAAARGSIMELAWFVEAETQAEVGVNPEHVVALRAITRS